MVHGITLFEYIKRREMEGLKPQTEARMVATAGPLMEVDFILCYPVLADTRC